MGKKDRLKNGLDALFEDNFHEIDENNSNDVGSIKMVRISLLEPNKEQPRHEFDAEKLAELSANIAEHGVLQPLLVRPLDNGSYQIVAGERRWRASRMAGLKEVPVYIKDLTDIQVAQVSIVENIQREDLNPIEEAEAYNRLSSEFKMTHDAIANTVGKSRSQISNSLRLLKLSKPVQKMLIDGKIATGHAKILVAIENKENQEALAEKISEQNLTVRELEKFILETQNNNDKKAKSKPKKKKESKQDPFLVEAQIALETLLSRKVSVATEKSGGITMKVDFSDIDDFKSCISKLKT